MYENHGDKYNGTIWYALLTLCYKPYSSLEV